MPLKGITFIVSILIGSTLAGASSDLLGQISLSDYIQTEWLHFDQSSNPSNRAFYSEAEKNLFQIRRGRIKVTHTDGLMKLVVQPDLSERGVSLKDFYFDARLTKESPLSLRIGLFNRPNYEVEYSSSKRISPERSQVIREFYPGERDLGVMATYSPELTRDLTPVLQIGLFNGTKGETDKFKDIATRLTIPIPIGAESNWRGSIGGSFYFGGTPQPDDTVLRFRGESLVSEVGLGSGSLRGMGNRKHLGVEVQLEGSIFWFGKTELIAEYLTGVRSSNATRTQLQEIDDGDSIISVINEVPSLLMRDQAGGYVQFAQGIGKQLVIAAKYDAFDRNLELEGASANNLDDRSATIVGFGAVGQFGSIRVTAWYEIPTYGTDETGFVDLKDNKTTIRFQYKFH